MAASDHSRRISAALLAVSILVLVVNAEPAEAAFPGTAGAIAFTTERDGSSQIYRMNADGFGQDRLTDAAGHSFQPAWSADGKKIAFANNPGSGLDVWLMDANGDNEVNLSNNGGTTDDSEPSWFPSGKKIAYRSNANNNFDIWVMTLNAAGNAPVGFQRLTTHAEQDSEPAVSPNGKKVAFVSTRDGDREIYVMKANATEGPANRPKKLTNNAAPFDAAPDWSPNGKKIAFESDRTGNSEIFVMNADGTRQKNLTRSTNQEHEPAYSPDGKKIAYSEGFLFRDVWRMRSDGSNPVQLTVNSGVVDDAPSWQPLP